jgi:hypothetical protein
MGTVHLPRLAYLDDKKIGDSFLGNRESVSASVLVCE